jgi:hypothetical protein
MLERLIPHLAWPMVALVMFLLALPVIYLKLSDISRAILMLKEMPGSLAGTLKEFQTLASEVSRETKVIAEQVEGLQGKIASSLAELSRTTEQIRQLQDAQLELDESRIGLESKELREIVGADPAEQASESISLEEMQARLVGKWILFEGQLKQRVETAGREYNPKRPGQAAYVLTDRRRRPHITRETADLIARLGRQYRKFERLVDAKEEWLTPEVYSAFMRGLDQASRALRGENGAA